MKWQKETGLMRREEIRWIPKKPDCEGGRRGFMTVGLGEIKPAIYLLCIGYALSALIFISELLFRNVRHIEKSFKHRIKMRCLRHIKHRTNGWKRS